MWPDGWRSPFGFSAINRLVGEKEGHRGREGDALRSAATARRYFSAAPTKIFMRRRRPRSVDGVAAAAAISKMSNEGSGVIATTDIHSLFGH